MINSKEKESEGWGPYIQSQLKSNTRPLYQKVIDEYFKDKVCKSLDQLRAANYGSGAGHEDIELINMGWEVLSIDSCPLSREIVTNKTKNSVGKSVFFQGDFASAELVEKYDLIMSFYSLPFGRKKDLDFILGEISKHLKAEGIFTANFFGPKHEFVQKKKAYGISYDELLIKLKSNGFNIIELKSDFYRAQAFDSNGKEIDWDVLEVIAKKC
jgi:hypothetical protein